jgi:CHAT domain-containing protein/Flp pilus assembly protein TadD
MKKAIVLCLLAVPSVALSQELPKATEEGQKAAGTLFTAFVKEGGLKVEIDPKTKQRGIVVGDPKKLRELVKQRRDDFTPAARDFLLRLTSHPGIVAVLLVAGEEKGDPQATAFGRFFAARIAVRQRRLREARQDYEQAGKLFERLKMPDWQATSLNDLALVHYEQGGLARARTLHQQALDLRKQLHGERHPAVAQSLGNLGLVCKDQGDLAQARTLCQRSLDLFKQLYGERHPSVTASLNNLALVYREQGDLAQARNLHQQALELTKQLHGERHPSVATSLNNLAEVCRVQGDLPQARQLYQQALDLRRQLHGERHPEVAASLNNLALVCRDQGDLAQARTFCLQALDLSKQLQGERHTDFATALNTLALICQAQGKLAQARQLAQQVLDLKRQLLGERHPEVAFSLGGLAEIYREQGELAQARQLHQQALTLAKQLYGERHPFVAASLNGLAAVCYAQGELTQAHKLFQQALDLCKQLYGERHPHVASALNNLALVCRDEGDLTQARKLFQQALDRGKQIHGERHPSVATSLNNLATVCNIQGELAQARKFHQQALDLRRQLHGERHPDVAQSLNNLAEVCRVQGELARARQLHQEALDLFKQLHGERHPHVATSLNNLAEVCLDQGDLVQARKLHQQALDLKRRLHGERHPSVATSLNNLAWVCQAQGDLPSALRFRTEAVLACRLPGVEQEKLADLRPQDLTCDAGTLHVLHGLTRLLSLSNNGGEAAAARQAATAFALAADLLDRLRSDVLDTEEGKLFQGARYATLVPDRVGLAATLFRLDGKADDLHTAFTAIEQGRARVFLQALAQARSRQIGGVSGSLLNQERDLLSSLRGLDLSIQKENAKTLEKRNADLVKQLYEQRQHKEAELNRLAERMRQEYPQYAALQYPRPCSLQQARDCLHDNEVAVLFALDEKRSYAVVLQKTPAPRDKGQGVAVVPLPGAAVLAGKVRTLVDYELLQSDSRTRKRGAELYELLLEPLAPYIRDKDVLVVPDGVLWELPFELLVEGRTPTDDGKYLIETRQIRYSPSLTVLHLIEQWQKTRPAPREALWALADPVFSTDDPRAKGDLSGPAKELLERYARRSGESGWQRLPGTRREVQAIARLHGAKKEDVVLDSLASEKVLKTASDKEVLARKRYIHLATHGLLGSARGRPPSLVLSLVGNGGEEQDGGVNDGFLSFVEVTHLKLNADLVVLSACETGKGELRPGEGVVGLSRAFLYAGSRGVVCSLWQVDDQRTARLMQALYAELQKGKPSREALTAARRALIADEEPPLFWAPFILIGK